MRAADLWKFIYKWQREQENKGNYVDLSFKCRYSKCPNKEVIQIYNKDEWNTEHICIHCFEDDWGKSDYCVELPTLYDEHYVGSIFDKYGVKNEPKK